jgi:tRNA-dihydrouridine synthase
MHKTENSNQPVLYLAPLQGFTDFVYRKVYSEVFPWVDAFFIPYISVKNQEVIKKYRKEVLPENNLQNRVIPQILASDPDEIDFLANYLSDFGYTEINLNLGCPYPMVTNRGMGAGLLPHPEKIEKILAAFFEKSSLKLSVKLRAGLVSPLEIEKVIPVLNQFPLTEVILHPRIAKQLYEGETIESAFQFAYSNLQHRLVYNGDVNTVETFSNRMLKFPETSHFMLGRGVLMNLFLPAEIKGIVLNEAEKREKLVMFHKRTLEEYLTVMDNPGNALNKMKQFWIYFCRNFTEPKKSLKKIEKSGNISAFQLAVTTIFRDNLS